MFDEDFKVTIYDVPLIKFPQLSQTTLVLSNKNIDNDITSYDDVNNKTLWFYKCNFNNINEFVKTILNHIK